MPLPPIHPDAQQREMVTLYLLYLDAAMDGGDYAAVAKYARRIVDTLTRCGDPVPAGEPPIAREVDLLPPVPVKPVRAGRPPSQRVIEVD